MQHQSISLGFLAHGFINALRRPAMLIGLDGSVLSINDLLKDELAAPAPPRTIFYYLQGTPLEKMADHLSNLADHNLTIPPWVTELTAPDITISAIASPLPDDQGNTLGVLIECESANAATGKIRPTTINQKLIDDIQSRETRWAVAIASAEQGVWDHDNVRKTRFLSQTWYTMRGQDPNIAVQDGPEKWFEDVHPDDLDRIKGEVKRHETGRADDISYSYRFRHADGSWRWILSRGSVVRRLEDGRPARVIGTDTDITEFKDAEIEHRRMSESLNVALRAARMGRWEFDLQTGRTFWDDRVLEMMGISDGQNDRDAKDWDRVIHPDDRTHIVAAADRQLNNRQDYEFDYRIVRPDGQVRHLRSLAQLVSDPEAGDRYVGVNIDITEDVLRRTELEAARAGLEHEAKHDALTGLPNRRALDHAQSSFAADQKLDRTGVLHIDLDDFKQINDTLGHAAGDAVLVHAARIIRQHIPDGWMPSRVGGDEFVILAAVPDGIQALTSVAEAIIADMAQPFEYEGNFCNIGASVGIALTDLHSAAQPVPLIEADLALYAAKRGGRNQFRVFDTQLQRQAKMRKTAFDQLRDAFENGEIICHYQPQFDAQTLHLTGVEALVRWQSPAHGLLTPDKFLDTATEMGMLAKLDATVLQCALRDIEAWKTKGFDIPRVSVNVSADRLSDPGLAASLRQLNLPTDKIAFELLESALLDSFTTNQKQNLAALRDMGIQIEIDDFGTGHASIISLLRVAPDRLKIDRELTNPIVNSQSRRELVRTIIDIGHMQNVAVVAEGVETLEHAKILADLGCEYLQGYALANPMSASALADLLKQTRANGGSLSFPQ